MIIDLVLGTLSALMIIITQAANREKY